MIYHALFALSGSVDPVPQARGTGDSTVAAMMRGEVEETRIGL